MSEPCGKNPRNNRDTEIVLWVSVFICCFLALATSLELI